MTIPRHRLIEALLTSPSIAAAAASLGCTRKVIYRNLRDPEFRAALAEAEGGLLQAATARLVGAMSKANDTIIGLAGEAESQSVRLRAAVAIPELAVRLQEAVALEERVSDLEGRIEEVKRGRAAEKA